MAPCCGPNNVVGTSLARSSNAVSQRIARPSTSVSRPASTVVSATPSEQASTSTSSVLAGSTRQARTLAKILRQTRLGLSTLLRTSDAQSASLDERVAAQMRTFTDSLRRLPDGGDAVLPPQRSSSAVDECFIDLRRPEFAPRNYQLAAPTCEGSSACGRVMVCQGGKCQARGALAVLQAASAVVGSSGDVAVCTSKCLGKCSQGAAMRVVGPQAAAGDASCKRGQLYTMVDASNVGAMLDSHFLQQS